MYITQLKLLGGAPSEINQMNVFIYIFIAILFTIIYKSSYRNVGVLRE